jgi:alkanesulfonate monooxygenase SsuD/methylene tetrahydromethanopterin reductase-like flavin-dependent oxidoreductase (luciferase family)
VTRVGIIILPQLRWAEQADLWRRAEAYGFDHAWTYDHLTWDPTAGQPWGATVPTLAAAATVTSRIPLGTWVASPNFRHPVPFARELAALDDLSSGRAVLGIGAGGTGRDGVVLGEPVLPPPDRAARLEEFVTLLDLVLTRPTTTWRGRFYSAVDAQTTLPCLQEPRLPFVVAANGPRMMRLAARYGCGWATTGDPAARGADDQTWWDGVERLATRFDQVLAEQGRDPGSIDRMLSVDAAPTFSLVSASYFAQVRQRAAALGFTDVVAHWPIPGGDVYGGDEAVLDQVARTLAGSGEPPVSPR